MAAWLFGGGGKEGGAILDSEEAAERGMGPHHASSSSPVSLHRRSTLLLPSPTTARAAAASDGSRKASSSLASDDKRTSSSARWFAGASAVALMLLAWVCLFHLDGMPRTPPQSSAALLAAASSRDNDPCYDQWTDEQLVGKCFGLEPVPSATSAEACRRHCCGQGEACITWQFQGEADGRGCMAGGPVRLGLELAATGKWCEPTAPAPWKGHRVAGREADGGCRWEKEVLHHQCFGLGVERVREGDQGRLGEEECRARCCGDAACGIWQWREDKGCFMNAKAGHCEKDALPFVGRRKKHQAGAEA